MENRPIASSSTSTNFSITNPSENNNQEENCNQNLLSNSRYKNNTESLDNKPIAERGIIKTQSIDPQTMKDLILENQFSNDIHYVIEGDLNLVNCHNLTCLPDNLSVKGNMDLSNCTQLTAIPANLVIKGNLMLNNCTGLTTLPNNLCKNSIIHKLELRNCTGLTVLPDISVNDDLYLNGCTGLTELRNKISVGQALHLDDCTNLISLPEDLYIGADLVLNNCRNFISFPYANLEHLPSHVTINGDIMMFGCTSLTSLPNWITTLGHIRPYSTIRRVYIENTGLSNQVIERLRNIEVNGMTFIYSLESNQPNVSFQDIKNGLHFWQSLASPSLKQEMISPDQLNQITKTLTSKQLEDLVQYLERCTATAEYQNKHTRSLLAQRLIAMMSLLIENLSNEDIKNVIMDHIYIALTSCDDRIILTLNDLETLKLRLQAEELAEQNNDTHQLKELGKQMMRLNLLKTIAKNHADKLTWADPIEIELAFQIGIRKKLEIPGLTQNMIFTRHAQVSNDDIQNAIQIIEDDCNNHTKLNEFLNTWGPWQKVERQKQIKPFEKLPVKIVDHIDDKCNLTEIPSDSMVVISDNDTQIAYETLVKTYLNSGNNPFTGLPLDWSEIKRLNKNSGLLLK